MQNLSPLKNIYPSVASNLIVEGRGKVLQVRGPLLLAQLPGVAIGDICQVSRRDGSLLNAQVLAFDQTSVTLAPFSELIGVSPGAQISHSSQPLTCRVSEGLIGKVVDACGQPWPQFSEQTSSLCESRLLSTSPPDPLDRKKICSIFQTGIRSLDSLCTVGTGQRLGIFAGPGTGKSTLLGMIARNSSADLNVIALIGERGREVNEFIYDILGKGGLQKSIVVVATSDELPIRRQLAALTATCIAEYFRDRGQQVLLLMDSLTRMARALRDVSLSAGELPVRQGYTPSVFVELPRLLERSGTSAAGSITAFYTILTANDEANDPLAEEVKSLLDGHLVLSPQLALQGQRPAIDFLKSISRLISVLKQPDEQKIIAKFLRALKKLQEGKELLLFGAALDAELQVILKHEDQILAFLSQSPDTNIDSSSAWQSLVNLLATIDSGSI